MTKSCQASVAIASHFINVKDPRINRSKRHLLLDVIAIAILAVISGVDSWVAVVDFDLVQTWVTLARHDTSLFLVQ